MVAGQAAFYHEFGGGVTLWCGLRRGGIDIRKAGGKPAEVKAASASMSAAEPAIAERA